MFRLSRITHLSALGVGRMFEYSVYSNVSLIFEYILKLRILVITIVIICILYTYFCI